MITRIELTNFMSHRHTVIEPAEGLTVLVGPNNCGKSAVVTALQILAYNENSTYVTRHGEKHCCVTVHTDDGHEITWQRKNGSTSYRIDGKLFDRLRSGTPQELETALRMPKVDLTSCKDQIDIHFAMQKQPVFLLNEPGKTAASFFAASSDASRLIEMQKVHKERVRSRKQDARRLEIETESLQEEVNKLQTVESLADLLKQCEQEKLLLAAGQQKTLHLSELIDRIESRQAALATFRKMEREFSSLASLPDFAPTQALAGMVDSIHRLHRNLNGLSRRASVSEPLNPPPDIPDTSILKSKLAEIVRLDRQLRRALAADQLLQTLAPAPELSDLDRGNQMAFATVSLQQKISDLADDNQLLEQSLNLILLQIEQFVEFHGTCPTCLQPLSCDNVLQHLHAVGGGGDEE